VATRRGCDVEEVVVNVAAGFAADADASQAGAANRVRAVAETAAVITDTHEALRFIGSSGVHRRYASAPETSMRRGVVYRISYTT
jgi:hypothetical protein